jgi:hypothetical protein
MMRSSALAIEAGDDARTGALELLVRRVEQLETAARKLAVVLSAEHRQQLLVAGHDQAVARNDQADRRLLERGAVVGVGHE